MLSPKVQVQIAPRAIIVMGVSGSGKSTLGRLLARALHCRFLEGDAFHGPENVEKMRAGRPLVDADRWPWLDRIAAELNAGVMRAGVEVAACSALKRPYRERLKAAVLVPTAFIFLDADAQELTRRLVARSDHYMPASLLESQLQTLEAPGPDECALKLDARTSLDHLCGDALAWLAQTPTT